MAMDTVLKNLEARLEELLEAYRTSRARERDLETRVHELEGQLASGQEEAGRVAVLESQRAELLARLEKVLATLDAALEPESTEDSER